MYIKIIKVKQIIFLTEQRTKYYHYSKQEKAEVMSSFKGLEIILFGADFLR